MKKVIAVFLSAVLLTMTGCASGQQDQGNPVQNSDILPDFYAVQVVQEILTRHENVTTNTIYFDAQENKMLCG